MLTLGKEKIGNQQSKLSPKEIRKIRANYSQSEEKKSESMKYKTMNKGIKSATPPVF